LSHTSPHLPNAKRVRTLVLPSCTGLHATSWLLGAFKFCVTSSCHRCHANQAPSVSHHPGIRFCSETPCRTSPILCGWVWLDWFGLWPSLARTGVWRGDMAHPRRCAQKHGANTPGCPDRPTKAMPQSWGSKPPRLQSAGRFGAWMGPGLPSLIGFHDPNTSKVTCPTPGRICHKPKQSEHLYRRHK
jgi:hypothetical protein